MKLIAAANSKGIRTVTVPIANEYFVPVITKVKEEIRA